VAASPSVRSSDEHPILDSVASVLPAELVATLPLITRGVWIIGYRELGDPALADEVAQETTVRLFDALARNSEGIRDPAAFARGIARHVVADIRASERRVTSLDAVENSADHARASDPLRSLVSAEQMARLRAALDRLSAGDRELLRALYGEDLKPGALARRLGETSERLRKRKSRALERLRAAFFGHEPPAGPTGSRETP
jgi:RNA polymerase sigma factor (sigma-70 family)